MSTKTEEVLENIDKSLTSISDGSERILSGVNRIHGHSHTEVILQRHRKAQGTEKLYYRNLVKRKY